MSKLDLRYQNANTSDNFFGFLLPSFVSFDTHETKESQDLKTERDLEIA